MKAERRGTGGLVLITVAAAVVLAGCATMRRSEARDTEQILAAAGFTIQRSGAGEPLNAAPPYRLISRNRNGAVEYVYADPDTCKCLFVGGPKEYAEYQRLDTERRTIAEQLWAPDDAWPRWYFRRPP